MGRAKHKLSAKEFEKLKSPGWHGDGGGLWLRVFNDGSKRWIFAWERNERRREMGLGPVADVTLAKARGKAEAALALLTEGIDPLEARGEAEEAEATPPKRRPGTVGNFVREVIEMDRKDHRYGDRKGRVGSAAGWSGSAGAVREGRAA